MSILIPRPDIAARWNGALEGRLRRAPLESFLRSRALPFAAKGPAQVTDNLTTATLAIMSSALQYHEFRYHESHEPGAIFALRLEDVAQITCAVSTELATLIHEPPSWRIPALVSSAQLLRGRLGLSAAAHLAARVARAYTASPLREPGLADIRRQSARAVIKNDDTHYRAACQAIAQRLSPRAPRLRAESSR